MIARVQWCVRMQLDAQKGEMRAAVETMVEAEKEMEAVHFEKRQLLSHWNSSLRAISARETSLAAIKAAIHEQQEQDLSISNEIHRFRKDALEQQVCSIPSVYRKQIRWRWQCHVRYNCEHWVIQVRHETLSATVEKLECDIQSVKKSMDAVKDKGERMQEMLTKLERAQSSMDERLQQCNMHKQALNTEITATDKLFTRSNAENMAAEDKMLAVLGEQLTVEKGSAGAAAHIQKKQKAVRPMVPQSLQLVHV
jgi:coiled-coil domain-containing protein 40